MSKKVIVLIEILVCVGAIVLVSIFGNVAESWRTQIYAESVEFVDQMSSPMMIVMYDKNNQKTLDNNLCVRKTKTIQLDSGQTSIQLKWRVIPESTTNKSVNFYCDKIHVKISETGLVENITASGGGVVVRIEAQDGSGVKDVVTIKPHINTSGGIIDLD